MTTNYLTTPSKTSRLGVVIARAYIQDAVRYRRLGYRALAAQSIATAADLTRYMAIGGAK